MARLPAMTVPTTYEDLLDREWLHAALADIGEDEAIVAVERTGTSKTRAEKLRFAVTVEGRDGRRVGHYCAKAHLDGSSGGSVAEAQFYLDLAPRLDVRMPRVHYVAIDGGSAIIVMEDVVASGGEFMSPHHPLSVETARSTLSQLARLHGSTWGLASVADVAWLGNGLWRFATSYDAATLQALLDDGRAEGFAPELCNAGNLVAALQKQATHGVTCVLHGDTHTGNVYLDAQRRGCWYDWEVVQTGHWAQDVAYHLSTALSIEDRRAYERDLLRHYLGELAAQGAPAPAFDDAWDLYRRSFSYGYLLWVITQIRGRDEVLAHMPRIAAAMTDHQTYRLLGVT
jgi:aminoglycoside phosphotransferase (APT) family kinase protein